MQQIEAGPITTEWYKPWSREKILNNLQPARVLTWFYGKKSLSLCERLIAGETFSRKEAESIDAHFLKSSQQIYNLPKKTDPQEFFLQQSKGALAAIRYFSDLVPGLSSFELKDEIADFSDRPSDVLRMFASPFEGIDPVLAYEAQRHALLIYQLGTINARTLNGRLRTVLSDVNRLLNKELFKGPEGHGEDLFIESFHDDETNQVVGFLDHGNQMPWTAHLKRVPLTVRRAEGIGLIRTKSRKKNDSVAIMKSWVKAINNGGTVHIDDAVQDSIGREFVLMDDSVLPKNLADKVVSIIQTEAGVKSNFWEIPKIIKVEQDDESGNDRGQSIKSSFDVRRKIWFENISTPIELKFSNRETYLNAELEVGTRDPESGLFMGRAHDLFELRRCRDAVSVAFPLEIYKINDREINTAFVNRSKQVAYGLRNLHK